MYWKKLLEIVSQSDQQPATNTYMIKTIVKELALWAGLCLAVSLGFVIQHWKKITALGISAVFLILLWNNMRLRDELTFTQGCLTTVQDNLVRTDLELDRTQTELNNLKNHPQTQQKEVSHD